MTENQQTLNCALCSRTFCRDSCLRDRNKMTDVKFGRSLVEESSGLNQTGPWFLSSSLGYKILDLLVRNLSRSCRVIQSWVWPATVIFPVECVLRLSWFRTWIRRPGRGAKSLCQVCISHRQPIFKMYFSECPCMLVHSRQESSLLQ